MNYRVGNIKNYKDKHGWICGQFFTEGSGLKTKQLEVKYAKKMPGETSPEHYHPKGEEILIIIKGKVRIILNEKEYVLKSGDFIFQKSRTHETITEVIEPTTFIAIRTPSVPKNKIIVVDK